MNPHWTMIPGGEQASVVMRFAQAKHITINDYHHYHYHKHYNTYLINNHYHYHYHIITII
jgi:hypothetical protein